MSAEREQLFDKDWKQAIGGITNQNGDRDNVAILPSDLRGQV
jgi:hypothetical protein